MEINGKRVSLDDLMGIFEKNTYFLEKYGNIFLTKKEAQILASYGICYEDKATLNDLRIEIENILDYDDAADNSELEWVLDQIAERNYYQNTRK